MKRVFLDTNILVDYAMLQYQCAKAGNCDVIITNNKDDFAEFCKLSFMTAAEFLSEENPLYP